MFSPLRLNPEQNHLGITFKNPNEIVTVTDILDKNDVLVAVNGGFSLEERFGDSPEILLDMPVPGVLAPVDQARVPVRAAP
jgi:hypothetical protein